MQVNDSAASMVAELRSADIEIYNDAALSVAALPVHLPDAHGEAGLGVAEAASSKEVRGLLAAIRRLESVVENETIALETGKKIDFDDFSARKSQGLLE